MLTLFAWIAGVPAVLFLIALIVSPRCSQRLYSGLIFGPDAVRIYPQINVNGIVPEDVYLDSDGYKLHGWFFKQESPHVVLIHHSNAGNVLMWTSLVEHALTTGASVFIYDYRGYGRSEGTPTVSGICRDGLAAYRHLVDERSYQPGHIVHFGSSLGGGVACEMAYRHKCAGLILHGAFSSLREMATLLLSATRYIPSVFFFRPKLDNAARLAQINVPVLLLHGRWDDMIPLSQAQKNLNAAAGPKSLVELQAGHMDVGQPDVFEGALTSFVSRVFGKAHAS